MKPRSILWRRRSRQEVLWCAKGKIEKVIHIENGLHKGQFRRARLRPIVCRAWAGQGCPNLTKRFAPVVRFAAPPLTSPVPTWDLALRICAPGILAGKRFQVFTAAGWLTSCSTHEPCLS